MDNLILEYIRATTNLYGIVSLEKVVEIYNQQNEKGISLEDLNCFKQIQGEHFEYMEECFVHEAIFVDDSFSRLKAEQANKPYYIPSKKNLLKYADDSYVERTKEYKELYTYIQENMVRDPEKADELTDDIQLTCALDFSLDAVMDEFNRRGVSFNDESNIREIMSLIMNLYNNTRIWENRGHTPFEIFNKKEKSKLLPLPEGGFPHGTSGDGIDWEGSIFRSAPGVAKKKVGRNDPCPCGSGKKYKKCCLGKES